MPNGMPPGARPGLTGARPGLTPDPIADQAIQALDHLTPKTPNPTEALRRVDLALDLIHKLVMLTISQVQQWSPKAVKDLHQIGRMAQTVKSELRKEVSPGPPPELLSLGMGAMGPTGGPPGGPGGMM